MFEIGFLFPKNGKEREMIKVQSKNGFEAERNGLQANNFLK